MSVPREPPRPGSAPRAGLGLSEHGRAEGLLLLLETDQGAQVQGRGRPQEKHEPGAAGLRAQEGSLEEEWLGLAGLAEPLQGRRWSGTPLRGLLRGPHPPADWDADFKEH